MLFKYTDTVIVTDSHPDKSFYGDANFVVIQHDTVWIDNKSFSRYKIRSIEGAELFVGEHQIKLVWKGTR